MPQMAMAHDVDPADEIFRKIGDLGKIDVMFGQMLVAIYLRPERTASGIVLPARTRDEDEFQGKAALVLKKGPMAFVDTPDIQFHGQTVDIGDWVALRPSDGMAISINSVKCRLVQDVHCKIRVPAPDIVW